MSGMISTGTVALDIIPDWMIVVGDVNSTLACALTAKTLGIRVARVEAGLRSRDMSMPEEINRLCTDAISDLLVTTDTIAGENLEREGCRRREAPLCREHRDRHSAPADRPRPSTSAAGRPDPGYAVLTSHRPANIDSPHRLALTLRAIYAIADRVPVIFPVSPRTAPRLKGPDIDRCVLMALSAVLIYCVVIGSLLPAASAVMVDIGRLHIKDKVIHLGAYLVLSSLLVIGFRDRRRGTLAGLLMFVFGVLLEAGQHFSPGRAVELEDVLATGAVLSCA